MENKRPLCKYGDKCFRKNPNHLKNFEHSSNQLNNVNLNLKTENEELIEKSEKLDLLTKKSENFIEQSENLDKIEKFDLSTISDIKKFVTEINRMEMPDDFYQFLEFCKSLNESDPKYALIDIGIELTGIFDLIITGYKLDYRVHARYFLDPPEFQTVLKVLNSPSETHFGYFRDDPDELPVFVAISEPKLDCKINIRSDNLFGALNWYIDELISGRSYKIESCMEKIKKIKANFDLWCEKLKSSKSFSLSLKTPRIKSREKKVNAKTFHSAGIVVPLDSNGFGYREIPETYEKQKQLFKTFCDKNQEAKKHANDRIQEIITLIQFANDEIDYGMGLEFGLNMFCFGDVGLNKFIKIVLPVCYELLGRSLYAEIISEHLKIRKL